MTRATKPNIILIMTDQHHYQALGNARNSLLDTPNISRLCEGGTLFENAYTPSPICGPARAALMTGRHAPECGVVENWLPCREGIPLLTDHLHRAGYFNALVGKLHLFPVSAPHGFDWRRICDAPYDIYDREETKTNDYLRMLEARCYPEHPERAAEKAGESEKLPVTDSRFWTGWSWADDASHLTTWTGNEAVGFLEQWDHRAPLFLKISFFGPHHPYSTCEPWDSLFDPDAIPLPSSLREPKKEPIFDLTKQPLKQAMAKWSDAIWKDAIAKYYGHVRQIDFQVGRILDALRERGMDKDTLIVFLSDHGDHLGNMGLLGKCDCYETSLRIPLILRPPAGCPSIKRCSSVVNLLDVYATLLDFAGVDDRSSPGRSMAPLLDGNISIWKDETFAIYGANANASLAMIRRKHCKLIGLARKDTDPIYEM